MLEVCAIEHSRCRTLDVYSWEFKGLREVSGINRVPESGSEDGRVCCTRKGPFFLRWDLLQLIKLDWENIAWVHKVADVRDQLDKLYSRYQSVFRDDLGCFRKHQATLHLKERATTRYLRPRVVPFALQEAVEKKLEKLVSQSILEQVTASGLPLL